MRWKIILIFASFALLPQYKTEQIQISIHGPSGPEDPVELGKPFTVNCKLNNGFDSNRSQKLSIFLNCPFRPEDDENISCFQGCSQLCMEDTKCKNYDILQSTKCQYVHDSNEGLTYSYRFPEFTRALIDQRKFSCKFEGTLSNIISAPFNPRLHKPDKKTASMTTSSKPTTTTSTTTATPVPETTKNTLPSSTEGANTVSKGHGEDFWPEDPSILGKILNFIIKKKYAIIIFCAAIVSLLLNLFFMLRCALIKSYAKRHLPGCLGAFCCMRAEVQHLQNLTQLKDRKKKLEPLLTYQANNHSIGMENYCYPNDIHRMRAVPVAEIGANFHARQSDDGSLPETFKRFAPEGKTFIAEKRNSGSGISSLGHHNSIGSSSQPMVYAQWPSDPSNYSHYSLMKSPQLCQMMDGNKVILLSDPQVVGAFSNSEMASSTHTESPINYPGERGHPVGINSTYGHYHAMSTSPKEIISRGYLTSNQSYGRIRSPDYLTLAPMQVPSDYLGGRGSQTQVFSDKLDSRKKENSDSGLGCGDKTQIHVEPRRSENNSMKTEDDISDFSDNNMLPAPDLTGGLIKNSFGRVTRELKSNRPTN